eukprot:Amastigsp_a858965_13.p1 type:complete len:357 gc:universal Amastigsp_a858965_13:1100-30(-)
MSFGQLVVGPPGSGKSTYCNGMEQFMKAIGRPVAVINLDPANDTVGYECAIDIGELICLESVMSELELGPNGGLIYCMEYLAEHMGWLHDRLAALSSDTYLLFDCPGQVELYTINKGMKQIVEVMTRRWGLRLAAVHLVDAHYCAEPFKYISVLLVSLSTMVQLELPHVNVLSKIDLIESVGTLAFGLEYYLNADRLDLLLEVGSAATAGAHGNKRAAASSADENSGLSDDDDDDYVHERRAAMLSSKAAERAGVSATPAADALAQRYQSLTSALSELIEQFSLVRFTTLNIQDKESVHALLGLLDKTNGYMYSGLQNDVLGVAFKDLRTDYETVGVVQEKYMKERPLEDDLGALL